MNAGASLLSDSSRTLLMCVTTSSLWITVVLLLLLQEIKTESIFLSFSKNNKLLVLVIRKVSAEKLPS